jgi:3-oxoacyl-[acyl-carrier protein] reductase
MDLGLSDRVALVTGASRGIGRAIAAELIAEGARVAITSRSAANIQRTAKEIGAVRSAIWDSGDVDAVDPLVDEVEHALGPIEILVLSTGGPAMHPDDATHFARAAWESAYAMLVLGPLALAQRVLPNMRQARFGRIINIASVTVLEPSEPVILSASHRASIVSAFKAISRGVAGDGVTLNSILPGRVATDALAESFGSMKAAEEAARTEVPAGRLGRPEELAALAAFLCSERASFVTGTHLAFDGGRLRSV